MAKICGWCGNRVAFSDIDYAYETVDNKDYCICGVCFHKILAAKKGQIGFDEITTENTAIELYNHVSQSAKTYNEMIQDIKIKQQKQQIKVEAQQTNPLYEDIHQIAGDLRFIKNWLIFCIVVGCIIGFFYFVAILSRF